MKKRTDFVSNSSSCSFMITAETSKIALKVIRETFTKRDVDSIQDNIGLRVGLGVKNKNYKELEEYIFGSSSYVDTYEDWKTGKTVKKSPEDIGWDRIELTLEQFFGCVLDMDDRLLSMIEDIYFDCEDYMMFDRKMMNRLFRFFERHGCSPDASCSEQDFIDNEVGSFEAKLEK